MKILSNGNLTYSGNCPKCGCIFEMPFNEIPCANKVTPRSCYYATCPQCTYCGVLLSQVKSIPIAPPDADEPITAQELYDFLQSFEPDSLVYVYINGAKWPVMEMSDDNADLVLIANKFNERPNE